MHDNMTWRGDEVQGQVCCEVLSQGSLVMAGFHAGFCDDFAGQAADGVLQLLKLCTSLLRCRQGLGHSESS